MATLLSWELPFYHQYEHVQQVALRRGEGFRTGAPDGVGRKLIGCAPVGASRVGQGIDCAGQIQTGQAQFCLQQLRQCGTPCWEVVQDHGGSSHGAHPVQR